MGPLASTGILVNFFHIHNTLNKVKGDKEIEIEF
jgi:hypothetical protein